MGDDILTSEDELYTTAIKVLKKLGKSDMAKELKEEYAEMLKSEDEKEEDEEDSDVMYR